MAQSCYNPEEAVHLYVIATVSDDKRLIDIRWQRMEKEQRSRTPQFFSTHPTVYLSAMNVSTQATADRCRIEIESRLYNNGPQTMDFSPCMTWPEQLLNICVGFLKLSKSFLKVNAAVRYSIVSG